MRKARSTRISGLFFAVRVLIHRNIFSIERLLEFRKAFRRNFTSSVLNLPKRSEEFLRSYLHIRRKRQELFESLSTYFKVKFLHMDPNELISEGEGVDLSDDWTMNSDGYTALGEDEDDTESEDPESTDAESEETDSEDPESADAESEETDSENTESGKAESEEPDEDN